MHKSKLAGFIIDCKTDDLDARGRVLGRGARNESRPHRRSG